MRTALRPYMTTGIAIVGASVIAVAPVSPPPPQLRPSEAAVVDVVRSVSTEVELTGLADALIAAVPQAVAATVTLFTATIPASAQSLIAAGKFAHLPALAVNAVILGTMAPVTPFLAALAQELPSPFGGPDGLIGQTWKLGFVTPAVTLSTVAVLMAEVIDDGLSPLDAVLGSLNALSSAIAATVESIQKIIGAVGGSLPFKTLAAPEELDNARVVTATADNATRPLDNPNVVPAGLDSTNLKGSATTATVTVDTSAPQNIDGTKDSGPTATEEFEPKADDKSSQESATGDVTPNGGTDLSDGNKTEPDSTGEKPAGGDSDGAATEADEDTAVKSATDDETAAKDSNADAAADSGGDEGSSGE